MDTTLQSEHRTSSMNPAVAVVEVSKLTKRYGQTVAVRGLDFSVTRGEIFGVLGSNGAGKTTAVECVQGIRRADSGSVRVLGCDPLGDRGQLAGRVGSQLQHASLPERLKVREALRLFADDHRQADKAMEEWELTDLASRPFADLSGGQQQRLFLALALLNEPEVVFLDELTQGLDPNARRAVWGLIEQVRDRGTTVVLVTHFMEEAEVLCDRVVVMVAGQAVDTGTPDELIRRHGAGVRMRFATSTADPNRIRVLPGVHSVEARGHELVVAGESSMIAYVGAELVATCGVPPAIRVDQPNLEGALINLIKPASPITSEGSLS